MKPETGNSSGELNGYLDRDSKIKGDLVFEETFRVDGTVEGDIHSSGTLILGENATIKGRVQVGQILVLGEVRGSIVGRESIEIGDTGRVFADIVTPTLIVAKGAVFQGNCNMPVAKSTSTPKVP
ncbi:MAG: polymer-forming cytoskeletal protein [Thermoanaerobaculia bacterium]